MAKEFAASKTQMSKAAELGIDTSSRPGYTTLGALLEAKGWTKDGKSPLGDGPTVATDHLESQAAWAALTPRERRERQRGHRASDRAYRESQYGDGQVEGGEHPNFALPVSSGAVPYEPREG